MRWACRGREAGPKLIRRRMATIARKRIGKPRWRQASATSPQNCDRPASGSTPSPIPHNSGSYPQNQQAGETVDDGGKQPCAKR